MKELAQFNLCPGYTLQTKRGPLAVERAVAVDVDTLLELYEAAAHWLTDIGIQQWEPGNTRRETLLDGVASGELYVVRAAGELAATLRLQWEDTLIWGQRPAEAGYVHKLIVSRAWAGCGLGRQLLGWAECAVASVGRSYLRLDCVDSNRVLYGYYLSAGFAHVGSLGKWNTALFEKQVVNTANSD